jgi:hypothetical protein
LSSGKTVSLPNVEEEVDASRPGWVHLLYNDREVGWEN